MATRKRLRDGFGSETANDAEARGRGMLDIERPGKKLAHGSLKSFPTGLGPAKQERLARLEAEKEELEKAIDEKQRLKRTEWGSLERGAGKQRAMDSGYVNRPFAFPSGFTKSASPKVMHPKLKSDLHAGLPASREKLRGLHGTGRVVDTTSFIDTKARSRDIDAMVEPRAPPARKPEERLCGMDYVFIAEVEKLNRIKDLHLKTLVDYFATQKSLDDMERLQVLLHPKGSVYKELATKVPVRVLNFYIRRHKVLQMRRQKQNDRDRSHEKRTSPGVMPESPSREDMPQSDVEIDPHSIFDLGFDLGYDLGFDLVSTAGSMTKTLTEPLAQTQRPAVEDNDQRPPHSYATLIGMAIRNAPNRRLTLAQIYKWIQDSFPFYRTVDTIWQSSIRKNLSLNGEFIKQKRSKDDPGNVDYWAIAPGVETQFLKDNPIRGARGTEAEGRSQNRAQSFGDQIGRESNSLFIGNLFLNANEDSIKRVFGQYGKIIAIRLPRDQESGQHKGFGYVDFNTVDEARVALRKLQGRLLAGRALRLDFTAPQHSIGDSLQRAPYTSSMNTQRIPGAKEPDSSLETVPSSHPRNLNVLKGGDPKLYMAPTISQDRTGTDEVNRKILLCALKERPRDLKLRKMDSRIMGLRRGL